MYEIKEVTTDFYEIFNTINYETYKVDFARNRCGCMDFRTKPKKKKKRYKCKHLKMRLN